jgi:hypothetical protein
MIDDDVHGKNCRILIILWADIFPPIVLNPVVHIK